MNRSCVCLAKSSTFHKFVVRNFSTSPFPFRPGYGLGSWLPDNVAKDMQQESESRAAIAAYDQLATDLESAITQMQLENPDYDLAKIAAAKKSVEGEKITKLEEFITFLHSPSHLDAAKFQVGPTSPVNWETSKIAFKDRASNSLVVKAQYVNFDRNSQDASAFSKDVSVAAKMELSSWFAHAKGQVAETVHKDVTQTSSKHDIESTLVLSATATHSKVMQFGVLDVDELLLLDAWNYYHKDKPLSRPIQAQDTVPHNEAFSDHSQSGKTEESDAIQMISECFLGSCLIGLVHLIKKEETDEMSKHYAESLKSYVQYSGLFGAISGDASVASNAAETAANLMSQGSFDVQFRLLCYGYCPTLQGHELQNTVKVLKNFDPASFHAEGIGGQGTGSQATGDDSTSTEGRREALRQSNMKSVIKATLQGITETSGMKVLDFSSFINAFDDYVKHAPKDDGFGVPIGFNLRSWRRHEIARLVMDKDNATEARNDSTKQRKEQVESIKK